MQQFVVHFEKLFRSKFDTLANGFLTNNDMDRLTYNCEDISWLSFFLYLNSLLWFSPRRETHLQMNCLLTV